MIEAELADGRMLEFPDGTDPAVIQATVKKLIGGGRAPPPEKYDPTEGMSWGQKALAGTGKVFVDAARGVGQLTGLVDQESIDAAKERDAPLMQTGGGITGNILGNVAAFAPTAFIPGANTLTGAGLIGAGMGALSPVASDENRLMNVGTGALAGGAGNLLARGISRVLSPQTSGTVKELLDADVPLTPGQIVGGPLKRAEEALGSIPIVGDVVRGAERRSQEAWSRAAINRAISSIGKEVPHGKAGSDAVAAAGGLVSDAYDDVLSRVTATYDDALGKAVDAAKSRALLPKDIAQSFDDTLQTLVWSKLPKNANVHAKGRVFKEIYSDLGNEIQTLRAGAHINSADRKMVNALDDVRQALADLLRRQNPSEAPLLKQVDRAYEGLQRARMAAQNSAAGAVGDGVEGVFTPAQLRSAAKSLETGRVKTRFAEGRAPMQRWAKASQSVMGKSVPDSGTPYRTLLALLGGGMFEPNMALAGGAAMLPYTQAGQKVTAALLTQRPELMRLLGRQVGLLTPYATPAAAGGLLAQ